MQLVAVARIFLHQDVVSRALAQAAANRHVTVLIIVVAAIRRLGQRKTANRQQHQKHDLFHILFLISPHMLSPQLDGAMLPEVAYLSRAKTQFAPQRSAIVLMVRIRMVTGLATPDLAK